MVRRTKFERGDVVRVNLNLPVGHERQGEFRPALVLSSSIFNATGVALVNMVRPRSIWKRAARARSSGRQSKSSTTDALACLQTIID